MKTALQPYLQAIKTTELVRRTGRIAHFYGLVLESNGPEAFYGERCEIYPASYGKPIPAEVIGIKEGKVLLMTYGETRGIGVGSDVIATGKAVDVPVGEQLLGRVIDAFGRPLDGKEAPILRKSYPLYAEPINPLLRPRIDHILETGVRAIDTTLTVGRGQRVGIFAGSGVGKSTLLGMIARRMDADVNVIALIGERGREVLDFIELNLGESGLARSVVVVATSDQPALVRAHAAFAATAIAEYFRDQGKDVVLTMDSITRFAMAQREIGLAAGEPPTARGYTPSVFALLPRLLERGGTSKDGGSITAFYTVLVEGDDINDPVSDSLRAILDGTIVLSRELANRGHYPSIDLLHSNSRLFMHLTDKGEREDAQALIELLSSYDSSRDMVEIGAYREGSNPLLDRAIGRMEQINAFLRQEVGQTGDRAEAYRRLHQIVATEVE
ncbi:MAG: FliI/YscN family ATPase [Candidatus Thiodiazotropha sp. (ex Rostrolucina anterorostrata)]|nr:FliI/YscN family ATPase [Candidatus Thiodiazotropha sp. (ex Rostrolucina anterorostrata)]